MERLLLVAARAVIGFRGHTDLPTHAAHALARGLDSPALREVAGLGPTDPAREVFAEALRELGADWPDEPTAHLLLAREAASAILAEEDGDTVRELAETVYLHLCHARTGHERWLDFCFSLECPPSTRDRLLADIRSAARALPDVPLSPCRAGVPGRRGR
ncbi:hypothetical protein NI17_003680 [Thermobifida halotolerans]|uniref:Uncharacterized protein n=1 Tax=Thermobifida halotolerans TaxID=483545 RepID=A0AA97M4U6_9ACTN|nr:hypothetical protein [Thermobifida halotolerans]UOE20350.1 hypothetical protein NI17_003680 [Thermobifida halotolerans]